MSSYIETETLKTAIVANEASEDDVYDLYAEAASRLFDLTANVEAEFFNAASDTATQKTFYGNDIDMLRIPPYTEISSVLVDDAAFTDYRAQNGFLIKTVEGDFKSDQTIKVTAKWGFSAIPAEIKTAVLEQAIQMWRRKDYAFTELSGVPTAAVVAQVTPTFEAVAARYKDLYGSFCF